MEDGEEKLKLLARHIYTCRDKTEDKETVFNFGTLSSLKCSVFETCEQGQRSGRDAKDSHYPFLWGNYYYYQTSQAYNPY
jgi:hypothetical protein